VESDLRVAPPGLEPGLSWRTVLDFEELHYLEVDSDGNPTTPNPFYGRPLLIQPPMSARIGLDFRVLE
jgi:hypothetical protein